MEDKILENKKEEKIKEVVKINLTSFNFDENNKKTTKSEEKLIKKEDFDEKLNEVLYKRALGYSSEEIIEEFQDDNGNLKLIKRKVTKKDIPPDITAVKILLEKNGESEFDLTSMSDEELENLRNEVMLEFIQDFDNTNT